MLSALPFLVTGCLGSTGSSKLTGVLTKPDAVLIAECSGPTDLPDKELTQEEVEYYWSEDRKLLLVCKRKHGAVVKYYKKRDEAIMGSKGNWK